MITCRELGEFLFDFEAGQLASEHREHFEQHLRLCSSCVAYVESYRLTIHMTRQLPRPPLPLHLAQRLRALLHEGLQKSVSGDGGQESRLGR
jgi:hypothetical protein